MKRAILQADLEATFRTPQYVVNNTNRLLWVAISLSFNNEGLTSGKISCSVVAVLRTYLRLSGRAYMLLRTLRRFRCVMGEFKKSLHTNTAEWIVEEPLLDWEGKLHELVAPFWCLRYLNGLAVVEFLAVLFFHLQRSVYVRACGLGRRTGVKL